MEGMRTLKEIYGKNAEALFVYIWIKRKIDVDPEDELLLQKFKVKAIDLNTFLNNKILQKGWGDKYYRCDKALLKNLWVYTPTFANLIESPEKIFL